MPGGKSKGSQFEREICVALSQWWVPGRDDIFWRSAASGARATIRGRKKKQTYGQSGDVCATDPIGNPLMDLVTIELKRGYTSATIHDLLDRREHHKLQPFEQWIEQARSSWKNAGAFAWLLITRRDQREALVWMPGFLADVFLHASDVDFDVLSPKMTCITDDQSVVGTTLEAFMVAVDPKDIKQIVKEL